MATRKSTQFGDLTLDLLIRLVPLFLSLVILFFASSKYEFPLTFERLVLTTVLGFVLSSWVMNWKTFEQSKKVSDKFDKSHEFRIHIVETKQELETSVTGMYETPGAVVYSTSINYLPRDIAISDSRSSDWARVLYNKPSCRTSFNRIVSVSDKRDRDWIKNMLAANKNPNYDLRIVEDITTKFLFPNMVLVEKDSEIQLFMSYRANASEGRFAFTTNNPVFVRGILQYLTKFHNSLPTATECVKKWENNGSA